MQVNPIEPFGCEMPGIDLAAPLSDGLVAGVRDLLHQRGFVLFRGQALDGAAQARFCRRFGPFSGHNESDREGIETREGDGPRLRMYYNDHGLGAAPELDFHSDNAHNPFSIKYLALYAIDVTTDGKPIEGGATMLASAARAVDHLPADLRERMERLEVRLTAQTLGSFERPCIERHWATGQPYLVPSTLTEAILGVPEQESARLLAEVHAVLYDPANVYVHKWREGDLLFWDNRLLHHARQFYDNRQTRTIRRCAIADELEPTAIA